ncbi:hypothetical protein GCM10009853_078790 [Glycomyces scopariae]|uniref:Uncharacterized protein n=1 Tax=Glycomyces sambucus TaxID=380244 RepID=A0A1G9EZ31_9ACTN|nr:hypothetical protein [Glycomyces sambucus]SDK81424.1 hypothetical protein SAMN05216298_1481 [Glycomyces sambucus]
MTYRYLTDAHAEAVLQSTYPQATQLPALSELLGSDLRWDQPARTLVFMAECWIEGTGYGQRLHTCAARNINSDKDLAVEFSRAARKGDPELVAAAADEVLTMVAEGVSAADNAAAEAAIGAMLHGGLTESPSRKPMFTALRTQWTARTPAS